MLAKMFQNDYTGINVCRIREVSQSELGGCRGVDMMQSACCKTEVMYSMMAATRQAQEYGAVVFSKIAVN
jgi:hypothetical protein